MQINPSDGQHMAQNAAKFNPKAQEQAKVFNDQLENASLLAQIQAAEETTENELREQKDLIETGSNMKAEEDTEEHLMEDLDRLKRKMKNVLDQQRKNLGLD